jgi:hypothetical protein
VNLPKLQRSRDPEAIIRHLDTLATTKAPPEVLPEVLPWKEIWTFPQVFQPRRAELDERHLQELVRAIKLRGKLDPVLVIWVGRSAVLVDGHHRLEAYRLAGMIREVPVMHFRGSILEAVLEAGKANSKTKLAMNTQERMDYAWRLVVLGRFTRPQIIEAAAVSHGQVATMRRTQRALGSEASEYPSWWTAMKAAKGQEFTVMSEEAAEEWKQALANTWADRMAKAFSTKMADKPEIAAMALEAYFGRRWWEVIAAAKDSPLAEPEFVSEEGE